MPWHSIELDVALARPVPALDEVHDEDVCETRIITVRNVQDHALSWTWSFGNSKGPTPVDATGAWTASPCEGRLQPHSCVCICARFTPYSLGRHTAQATLRTRAAHSRGSTSALARTADGSTVMAIELALAARVTAPYTRGLPTGTLSWGDVPCGAVKWASFAVKNEGSAPDLVTLSAGDVVFRANLAYKRPKQRRVSGSSPAGAASSSSHPGVVSGSSRIGSDAVFVVSPRSTIVAPGEMKVIHLAFAPPRDLVGRFAGTLRIVANGTSRTVQRNGATLQCTPELTQPVPYPLFITQLLCGGNSGIVAMSPPPPWPRPTPPSPVSTLSSQPSVPNPLDVGLGAFGKRAIVEFSLRNTGSLPLVLSQLRCTSTRLRVHLVRVEEPPTSAAAAASSHATAPAAPSLQRHASRRPPTADAPGSLPKWNSSPSINAGKVKRASTAPTLDMYGRAPTLLAVVECKYHVLTLCVLSAAKTQQQRRL